MLMTREQVIFIAVFREQQAITQPMAQALRDWATPLMIIYSVVWGVGDNFIHEYLARILMTRMDMEGGVALFHTFTYAK